MIGLYALVAALVLLLLVRGVQRLRTSVVRGMLLWLGGAFGVAFAVLSTLALRIPAQRNAPFRIKEELTRFGALGSGVVFLLAVLAAVLPIILDAIEARGFTS